MADRKILHCDLNNFFASVSLLYNPTLHNLPVAVTGSQKERHGIVLAKNELAKSYGVKTAEAIWEAKAKCPELVTIPPMYDKYNEFSKKAQQIYSKYTDQIEPFGIDECWLDVTGSTLAFGNEVEIAHKIRNEIKQTLGITVSIGVSFNKIFAKLGSDMKKPDAVTVINRQNFKEKVWHLPVSDLLFVGKSTAERLNKSGIFTIGDITLCNKELLNKLLGKNGEALYNYATGQDNSPVITPTPDDRPKSIGRSVTPPHDIKTDDEVWKIFIDISEEIARKLQKQNLYAGTVQVHTRTTTLLIKEFSESMHTPINISMQLARHGMEIFKKNYPWSLPLRSVGLRVTNLKDSSFGEQLDLFSEQHNDKKDELIESSLNTVRQRFGNTSIKRATTIKKDKA